MGFKLFIDINILVDLLDDERAGHKDAAALIDKAESGTCICYVTESVLNTTAYLVRKDYTVVAIAKMFSHLLGFILLLPVNTKTYRLALRLAVNDIEDAVLYKAAIENKLDYFVTSDSKDFKKIFSALLPVISSAAFIKLMD